MPGTSVNFWDGISAPDTLSYSPGAKEFTNLGLLQVRVFTTFDATASSDQEKISYADELSFVNSQGGSNPQGLSTYAAVPNIILPTKSKQLPGMEDAPTWNIMTDSPLELIGRTYAGKTESLSTMEFVCPAETDIIAWAIKHQTKGSRFTIIEGYNDPNLSSYYYIVTPRCALLGANTGSGENNSGAEYTIRFQPLGGQFTPVILEVARTSGT